MSAGPHSAWTPAGTAVGTPPATPPGTAAATPAAPATKSPAGTPVGETAPKLTDIELIDAIGTVFDPEIPVNIYELGLIYAIDFDDDGRVKVEMTLTAPGCPSAQELPEQVRDAIAAVPGVTACDVEVVWEPAWHPGRMSEEARLQLNLF